MRRTEWIGGGIMAMLIVAASVPAVRHLTEQPPPPPPALRLAFEPPAGSELGSVDESLDAAISPDGHEVVFVATTRGVAQLWRRSLQSGRTEVLPATEGARFPAWKRTGNVLSFFADGKLRQLSFPDGGVRDLADAAAPAGAAWMADGSLLFAPAARGPLRRMLDGRVSDATTLRSGERAHAFPVAATDAGEFIYVAFREDGRRTVRLAAADGERDLTDTGGHAEVAGPVLVYARDGVLLAQRVDPETRQVIGRSTLIAPAVAVSPAGRAMFAASSRLLLYSDAPPRPRDLAWLDPGTSRLTRIADPGDYWQVRLSPDDRLAAITLVDPLLRTLDVFVAPLAGGAEAQPLTRALAADTDPVWSTDGGTILFRSRQSGSPRLFTRRVGVRGAEDEPLRGAADGDTATDRRGSRVLLHAESADRGGTDLIVLDLQNGTRTPLVADPFNETDGRWSPDGEWVTYVSDQAGQPDVYVIGSARTGPKARVSFAGGSKPRWSHDGRAIYFVRGSRIMRADRLPGDLPRFTPAAAVFDAPGFRDFDAAHRSNRLAVLVAAPGTRTPESVAVVSWTSLVPGQ